MRPGGSALLLISCLSFSSSLNLCIVLFGLKIQVSLGLKKKVLVLPASAGSSEDKELKRWLVCFGLRGLLSPVGRHQFKFMSNILHSAKRRDRALHLLWRGHHKIMYRSELCQKFSLVLFLQQGALFTSAYTNFKESPDFLHQAGKLTTKSRDEANIVQCPGQMYCTNPGLFCTFKPYPD